MQGFSAISEVPLGVVPARPPGYTPTYTERWATRGWTARTDDVAPGQHIDGRLSPMVIERRIEVGSDTGVLGGVSVRSAGTIQIENSDGALDRLIESRSIDGRPIRLKVASARAGRPRTQDMAVVWSGLADRWDFSDNRIQIYTRDLLSQLDRPISDSTYAGTGGRHGSPSLATRTKPLGFGQITNAEPDQIDSEYLIYQFHDGRARALLAVRDMGSPLVITGDVETYDDLVQATVNLGEVVSCLAVGMFRLGDFSNGAVTCDFQGDGVDPALSAGAWDDGLLWDDRLPWDDGYERPYTDTAAGIILRLLTVHGAIPESSIDLGQFRNVERTWPHPMQVWIPGGQGGATVLEVASAIAEAAGLIISVNRAGLVYAKRIEIPTAGVRIGSDDIISISRIEPPYRTPIYGAAIAYGRNQTVQSESDLVRPDDEVITADSLLPYQQEYQGTAEAASSRTLERVKVARSIRIEDAYYTTKTGALARAKDIVALHRADRGAYRIVCKRKGWRLDLGDAVVLTHPRYGLADGKPVLVTAVVDDGPARQVTLDLLG